MGTWGTGILQNDTTADIWSEFKEYFDAGESAKKIRVKLEKEYKPEKNPENYGEIWTGIAYGQWMVGELETYTLEKLKNAVDESHLLLYADDNRLLKKRITAIKHFIDKIQTVRSRSLKSKKTIERPAFFKKGDIIGIKLDDKNSLVGLITDHNDHPSEGSNNLVLTDLIFTTPPTLQDVLSASVLYLDIGGKNNHHRGFFELIYSSRNMSKKIKDCDILFQVPVGEFLSVGVGVGLGNWNEIPTLFAEQEAFLHKNKTERPFHVSIYDILNPTEELENKLIDWDKKLFKERIERMRKT